MIPCPIENKNRTSNCGHKKDRNQPKRYFNRIVGSEVNKRKLEERINLLAASPITAYPDFYTWFILHTDASQCGFGANLSPKARWHKRRW